MLQTLEVSELLVSEVGVKCNLHTGNLRFEDLETYQTQYFKGLTVLTSSLSPFFFFFFMNEMSHQEFYQLIR